MEAIVVGGTGLVGSCLIEKLNSNLQFTKIISIGRKPAKITSSKISNLIIKDLSEIAKLDLTNNNSIFFCCLGSTIKQARTRENFKKVDYFGVVSFAELAKKTSSSKFILVSAKGADPRSSIFYNRTKGEAEQTIENMALNSVTIYRPGLLLGNREDFRFFELLSIGIVKGLKSVIGYDRLRPIVTSVDELAQSMLDDSLGKATGYKIVDSGEIKR